MNRQTPTLFTLPSRLGPAVLAVTLLIAALFPSLAHADATIVYEMKGNPMGDGQVTIRTKASKSRLDMPQMSTITDIESGRTIVLQHASKTAMEMPGDLIKQAQQMSGASATSDAAASAAPKLSATGKKENINGYECEEYIAEEGTFKMSYWLCKDFPLRDELLHQSAVLENALGGSKDSVSPKDMPGWPIRTVMDTGTMGTLSYTLVSANIDPVDETVFQVPPGYNMIEGLPAGLPPDILQQK